MGTKGQHATSRPPKPRADCDTGHYLVVAKVRERLAVSQQAAQNFDGERFNWSNLKDLGFTKEYQIEILESFAALAI
jgi:hypothetical protein